MKETNFLDLCIVGILCLITPMGWVTIWLIGDGIVKIIEAWKHPTSQP